ncbi:hypothetical protein D8I24_0036 (plasmid) [Cupriavidus necator H850]|nr:hypothetical protein D8I24_0036 [Cupriavidus necator H850]
MHRGCTAGPGSLSLTYFSRPRRIDLAATMAAIPSIDTA